MFQQELDQTKVAMMLALLPLLEDEIVAILQPFDFADITGIASARQAFVSAPEYSEAERLIMKKWLSFCTTVEEAKEAFDSASDDSEPQWMAVRRIYELM